MIQKRKKTYNNQYVVDFETLHKDTQYFNNLPEDKKDVRIIYWYAEHLKHKICGEGVDGDSFYNWLTSHTINTTLWFHNLGFDGLYIIPILINKGWKIVGGKYENGRLMINNGLNDKGELRSKYFKIFMNGNRIYEIQMYHKRRYKGKVVDNYIQIRCSYVMLSSSVEALGKSLGIEKREDDMGSAFYVREPQPNLMLFKKLNKDYVEYCQRDVQITKKSLISFNEAVNQLPTIKGYQKRKKRRGPYDSLSKSLTVGGLSRYMMSKVYVPKFERYYYDKLYDKNLLKISYDTHKFIKGQFDFYKGGFVQYNPHFLTNHDSKWVSDGIKIDVVSAYPYQMTFSLPYGEVYDEVEWNKKIKKIKGASKWNHGIEYQQWVVVEVNKLTPKPITKYCSTLYNWTGGVDEEGNIRFRYNPKPQKNFVCCLSRQEWDELQHWGEWDIKSIEYYYQFAAPYLKDYANEVIEQKTLFSKKKQGAFKQAMKILANSAYGSLGIRMQFDMLVQCDQEAFEITKTKNRKDWIEAIDFNKKNQEIDIQYVGDSLSKSFGDYKCLRFKEKENKEKKYFNIACAALITSLQRVYIWKTIRKIGVEYFAYSDTDSIIFVNFPPEKRKEIESMCGDELGMWEIEKRYIKGFTCRKAKDYSVVYLDANNNEVVENKNAGFKEKTEYEKVITNFYYENDQEYTLDNISIKLGSTTRVKYPSGILIVDIDKINRKSTI